MKVSVVTITYNHEKFIAQAVESALMQETNFEYEIIIAEDCSTDHTREIVIDFQKRFPDKIRLILPERNIGGRKNFEQALAACRGEYVALLEGDDYWTSAEKLQRQADFLDKHREYSACSHPVEVFFEGGSPQQNYILPKCHRESAGLTDIIKDLSFQTSSVMVRRVYLPDCPEWMKTLKMGDWPLFVLIAQHGDIAQLKDVMGRYRVHGGGIWTSLDDKTRYEAMVKMYNCLNEHFRFKQAKVIRPILADYYFKLAVIHDQEGQPGCARRYITKNIKTQLLNKQNCTLNQFKMLARLCFPSVYNFSKRLIKA